MEASFYWQAVKRYWWLVLLPVIVLAVATIVIENFRGPQYQTTMYFLVNSPFGLTSRDYLRGGLAIPPTADDQIFTAFDFSNIANSLQAAAKTIKDLDLPIGNALDLFKPPTTQIKPPSISIRPGGPFGDAASKGFLTEILGTSQLAEGKMAQAQSRWVELTALAYDRDLSHRLANTHAKNAVEVYRGIQTHTAGEAQDQVARHVNDAGRRSDTAAQALAQFETQHRLVDGGAEFQTAQQVLDDLYKQRTDLVAGAGAQETTRQRLADLERQTAALEVDVLRQGRTLGDVQARFRAERATAEANLSAAQQAYAQAFQTYATVEREFSLARAQGFPATVKSVQTMENPAQTTSAVTIQNEPGVTTNAVSSQPATTTDALQEQRGYTSSASSFQRADTSGANDSTTTGTTTGASSGTTTGPTTATGSTSTSGTTITTGTITSGTTSTGTNTTITSVPGQTIKTTTNVPASNVTTLTTTQPRTITSTSSSTSGPTTQLVTTEEPTAIRSEAEGLEYLLRLNQLVDQQALRLEVAQQGLAAVEAADPSASLSNDLSTSREKLTALRAAHTALLDAVTDPTAGLQALDERTAQQDQRIRELNAIAPEYRRLALEAQDARTHYEQLLQLDNLFARLGSDANRGAGVQLWGDPYTMELPSKLLYELLFAVMIGLLFGIALAFGVAFIGYLRSQGRPASDATEQG